MIGKRLHVIRIGIQHMARETAFFLQYTEMRRMGEPSKTAHMTRRLFCPPSDLRNAIAFEFNAMAFHAGTGCFGIGDPLEQPLTEEATADLRRGSLLYP